MLPSATYVREVSRAFSYDQIDYSEIIIWCFAAMIAVILLFVISKVIKKIAESNVRRIRFFGMDFTSAEQMLKKGVISEDEYRNIKKSLSRQVLEQDKEDSESAKIDLKNIVAQELQKREADKTQLPEQTEPTQPKPNQKKSAKTLNLDDMLKAGLISEDEYREMTTFFDNKNDS